MGKINKLKVIVFDFDGVIVDSNQLKYDAFFELFPATDSRAQQAVKKILSASRESTRQDILKQIFINLRTESNQIEKLVIEYSEKYNQKVQTGITKNRLISGAVDILSKLQQSYSLYIVSTTPQVAVRETIRNLGLDKYFLEVFGVPTAKADNLKNIMDKENVGGSEVLLVGDGESDHRAAKKFKCHFIGLANKFNGWQDVDFPLIHDLVEVQSMIDNS